MAATKVLAAAGALQSFHGNTFLKQTFSIKNQTPIHIKKYKRFFTCRAIYRPDVQIKEEGQPETLDYRLFFLDNSGKKLLHKLELWIASTNMGRPICCKRRIDVVEIGESQGKIGQILKVKPLAALAMIDEGELDWKIVAITLDDPGAALANDVHDVEKHFPGTLTAIRDWFRDYKIPDGKPANKFGLGNKAANKDYALKVITETNEAWAKLVKRSVPAKDLSLV